MNKEKLYDKGAELYKKERFGEAIGVLLMAYAKDPNDVDVTVLLAGCYINIAHFTDAARLLISADKLDPGNSMINYNLGYALLCMGRLNDAMKYMKKCLQLNPCKEIKQMAKRMINSKEHFAQKLENNYDISLDDEFKCEEQFRKAQKYLYSNQFEEAISLYKSILEKKPDFHRAIQNIGVCYIRDGKPEKALKYFNEAISISPKDELCLGNIAHAYYLMGNIQKSREYSEKAMDTVKKPLLRDLLRLVNLFIMVNQLEFARKLIADHSDLYDSTQLKFLSGVIYAKQKEYIAAKKEFQTINSETAKEYFEKCNQLINGRIREFDFDPDKVVEAREDMI